MMKEARGKPIAFLKDIINPYIGLSMKGNRGQLLTKIPFFYCFSGGAGFGVMRIRIVAPTSKAITTNQAGL